MGAIFALAQAACLECLVTAIFKNGERLVVLFFRVFLFCFVLFRIEGKKNLSSKVKYVKSHLRGAHEI